MEQCLRLWGRDEMDTGFDIHEISCRNKDVDERRLQRALDALKALKDCGILPSSFNIEAPYSRPLRNPIEDVDPRRVQLRK